ncbi:MAG: hypothetical protein AAF481_00870 [Acidobacteriota bacterium]
MWPRPFEQSSDVSLNSRSPRWERSIVLGVLLAALLGGPALYGQETAARLPAEASETFEVLPTRIGLLLRPRSPEAPFRTVEITGDEVAVDGELVAGDALDRRLGDFAPQVRRLVELSEADRRVALGLAEPAPRRLEVRQEGGEAVVGAVSARADEDSDSESKGDSDSESEEDDGPHVQVSLGPSGFGVQVEQAPRVDLGQRVSLGESVEVGPDEEAEEAVAIGGPVRVYGEVEQDVLAVGGSAHVDGKVGGEVVAVAGSVYLGSEAQVAGNVTSVGGRVHREGGAEVGGVVSEVSMGRLFAGSAFKIEDDDYRPASRRSGRVGSFFGQIAWAFFLALLVWLIGIVFARPMERIEEKIRFDTARAGLAGLLTVVLFLPMIFVAALILVISVIGIPLLVLIPVVFFVGAVAVLFGYAAAARVLGRKIGDRFGRKFGNGFRLALVGIAGLHLWSIVAAFFGMIGGPLYFFDIMFFLFGLLVQIVAALVGLGAVILTRFGAGPREEAVSLTPPPVPPPFEPLSPISPSPTAPSPTDPAGAVEDPAPASDPPPAEVQEDLPVEEPEPAWVEMEEPVDAGAETGDPEAGDPDAAGDAPDGEDPDRRES